MARVGIVGSRKRRDRESVIALVAGLPAGTIVVSGGCPDSVDVWAEEAAQARGLETIIHRPAGGPSKTRWEATEKFYARNQKIVDDSDELYAFVSPDRKGGTEDTIKRADKKGIPVNLV